MVAVQEFKRTLERILQPFKPLWPIPWMGKSD